MKANRKLKRNAKRELTKQIKKHLKAFRKEHGLETTGQIEAYKVYREALYVELGIWNKWSELALIRGSVKKEETT